MTSKKIITGEDYILQKNITQSKKAWFLCTHKIFCCVRGRIWRRPNDVAVFSKGCSRQPLEFLFFLIILFFIAGTPAHAAGFGLSLYPPLLRVNIKPGKSITQAFTINNLTSDDKTFVARIVPFTGSDTKGNPQIDLRSTATWLNYFSLSNADIKLGDPFVIKGGNSQQLILALSVPETALLKDLYATLLVSTYGAANPATYQGSAIAATVGSNILITVSTELNPPTILKINNLRPVSGTFIKFGNYYLADNISAIQFSAQVTNAGDFSAETKGVFRVSTRKDLPLFLQGILPVNVISGSTRIINNTDGKDFTFSPTLGNIGAYRVSLQINTDNSNAISTITLVFIPFKILIALLIAVAVVSTIIKINPRKNTIDTTI